MKNTKSKKELLLKELRLIQKQEERDLGEKHYPEFKKRFEGKFFK